MTSIFGWFTSLDLNHVVAKTTARMTDGLPPRGDSILGKTTKKSGLFVKTVHEEVHRSIQDGVEAVVDGSPRWTQSRFDHNLRKNGIVASIIEAYLELGTAFLRHLHGEYALAIIDHKKNVVVLAIDRMGIRPLCYAFTHNVLVFGSTTDTVRQHPNVTADINYQALYDYIYFHVIPSPITIYKDIRKLEPGQYVVHKNGKTDIKFHWHPIFHDEGRVPFHELKGGLHRHLWSAVRKTNLIKDIGCFLSGGLDSSTVAGILADITKNDAPALSIGFSTKGYDEIEYARIAAKHFGNSLHEYYVSPKDVMDAILIVARTYDEPFGNSSAIPTFYCANLARKKGIRLMLAGDGGDELFAGNERYRIQKLFSLYNTLPRWLRHNALEPLFLDLNLAHKLPFLRKVQNYIKTAQKQVPERMDYYNFLLRTSATEIFNKDFLVKIDPQHPLSLLREVYNRAPTESLINKMLFLDWKFTLADNDLRKVNVMCELAGIQVNYPMLDDDLVEFSTQVPSSLKLKGLRLRYFYKKALNDFLPSQIIHKSKHGFGLPFGEWLRSSPSLQRLSYDSLQSLKTRGILRSDFIDKLIRTHRTEHAAYFGTMIWVLMMLEFWYQEHMHS
jgi:asparagine synthase (glutamine-hydrolysing)